MLEARPLAVRRDNAGRFLVVGRGSNDGTPKVFDSEGAFLRRIGRVGSGPGEFLGSRDILFLGDSVAVFDVGNGRVSLFTSGFKFVRSSPVPPSTYSAAFAGGTFFLNAKVADRMRIGYPLHRFSRSGDYLGPIGEEGAVLPGQPLEVHWLAASRSGGVWAARANGRYAIERWGPDGTRLASLTRHPEWYPDYSITWVPTPTRPPPPALTGVWEDRDGLLWVIGIAPDPKWREGLGKPIQAEGRTIYPWVDHHKLFDGIVEVIDPSRGELIASLRVDVPLDLVVGGGFFTSYAEGGDKGVQVDVWRLALKR